MAMTSTTARILELRQFTIEQADLYSLIQAIPEEYRVIGPKKENYSLNLGELKNPRDLALGYISEEDRGIYRLYKEEGSMSIDRARYMNHPKYFTHLPTEELYRTKKTNGSFEVEEPEMDKRKLAFVLIKSCDISALHCMDRVFDQKYKDPSYNATREDTLIIGANCFHPGKNCFCTTFNAGPTTDKGFDLQLSDFGDKYMVEVGTEKGAELLSQIPSHPAGADDLQKKEMMTERSKRLMFKAFDIKKGVKTLNENYEHPYWDELKNDCFSCTNCISVCPLCFCYEVSDESNVTRTESRRVRKWDACQDLNFAGIHGANFREDRAARLKHWVNHKIHWQHDQYGCSGCTGCSRCITWCPIGIDITEPVWHAGGKEIGLYEYEESE